MIGLPAIFVAVAYFGLRQYAAPPIPQPAVARLKNGAVRTGMSTEEVVRAAGEPKSITEGEDGRTTYRYMSSAWDVNRGAFVEEDAYVDFDSTGRVSNISFDSQVPTQPR